MARIVNFSGTPIAGLSRYTFPIPKRRNSMESDLPVETFAVRVLLTDEVLRDLLDYSYSGHHSHLYLDALEKEVANTFGAEYSHKQLYEMYTMLKPEVTHSDGQMYMTVHFERLKER